MAYIHQDTLPEIKDLAVIKDPELRAGIALRRAVLAEHLKWTASDRALWRTFRINAEDWARMHEAQGGRCAGCRALLTFTQRTHVDHCHTTGRIRSLLCQNCNCAIGMVFENPETLRRLLGYVERECQLGAGNGRAVGSTSTSSAGESTSLSAAGGSSSSRRTMRP